MTSYNELFDTLAPVALPHGLNERVLSAVRREEGRIARIRLAIFASTTALSLFALIPVYQYAANEFIQSGFREYSSLFFTDTASMLLYWKQFSLLLAESFPVFATILVFGTLLSLLGSLRSVTKYMQITSSQPQLA